jgi:hypothetical protein
MKGFAPGDPRAVAAGRRGGQRSGDTRRHQAAVQWAAICGEVPESVLPIIDEIYQRGYQAGWIAGRRHHSTSLVSPSS